MHAQKVIDFGQHAWTTLFLAGMDCLASFHQQATPAVGAGIQKHAEIFIVFTVLFAGIEIELRVDLLRVRRLQPVSVITEAEMLFLTRGGGPKCANQGRLLELLPVCKDEDFGAHGYLPLLKAFYDGSRLCSGFLAHQLDVLELAPQLIVCSDSGEIFRQPEHA